MLLSDPCPCSALGCSAFTEQRSFALFLYLKGRERPRVVLKVGRRGFAWLHTTQVRRFAPGLVQGRVRAGPTQAPPERPRVALSLFAVGAQADEPGPGLPFVFRCSACCITTVPLVVRFGTPQASSGALPRSASSSEHSPLMHLTPIHKLQKTVTSKARLKECGSVLTPTLHLLRSSNSERSS